MSDSWSDAPVSSDFTSALGKEVHFYFKRPQELAALRLSIEEDGSLKARLVGIERLGVWLEPAKESPHGEGIPHYFIGWENILSVLQFHSVKKGYRGLRPS